MAVRKMTNGVYGVIILILTLSCIFFLSENCLLIKNLNIKNYNFKLQETKSEKSLNNVNAINYGDVLQKLDSLDGVQILNFTRSKNGKIAVKLEISGDKEKIADTLKKIRQRDNFYNMGNIKIEQDKCSNIKAKIDVNFT
ncbi:hypothetical protein [uncultured Clostridium sp.]|jgi:hypothetical protein|uniref:hypothetical protein n=1 Tax=uncultured Clostridium sp. TaxID=59620 RepID=UPI0025D6587F|nr:hypothetical protein [uncultured Clostridium sp.]